MSSSEDVENIEDNRDTGMEGVKYVKSYDQVCWESLYIFFISQIKHT